MVQNVPTGIVLFSGATDWEDVGRKNGGLPRSSNTVWKPKRLAALKDVNVVSVSSGPSSVHMFAIAEDGAVYGWGRNEKGQLGLGDTKDRKCPTLLKEISGHKVVKAATGKNHSLFLTGTILCHMYVERSSIFHKVFFEIMCIMCC